MEEIEIKILEINVKQVVLELIKLGATKTFEGDIDAAQYGEVARGSLLRLRRKGNKSELTFKEKISSHDVKVMREIETNVDDYEAMHTILTKLGYKVKHNLQKKRVTYKINDVLFEFDTIRGIPTFLEIEGPTKDVVFEWVEKLGFKREQALPWSTSDLFKHYKKK